MFTPFAFIQPITIAALAPVVTPVQYLLLGGGFNSYNAPRVAYIAKIDSTGSLDPSFNVGAGTAAITSDIQVQPDGKFVAVGQFTTYSGSSGVNRIVRLNSDGTRDTTFNTGTGFSNTTYTVNPQSDNSNIVSWVGATGTTQTYSGSRINGIVKIAPSGNIDTSFNTGFGFNNIVTQTVTQADGKIIAIGSFSQYSASDASITRTDLSGSRNLGPGTDFNTGFGFNNSMNAAVTQSDGKIIIAGDFTAYSGSTINRVARLNSNGTLDTTFNPGTGFNSSVFDVKVQSDGKIILVGAFATYSGSTSTGIVRLNSNGTRDTTFNVGTGFGSAMNRLAILSDGKILVAGQATTYSGSAISYLVRLNTSGSRDTSFNTGAGFNAGSAVYGLAIQSDNKIIAAGLFSTYSGSSTNTTRIIRLNTDGTQDTSFVSGVGFNSTVWNAALQSDGKIIAAGAFTTYSGSSISRLARLNTNGTLDTTFNPGNGPQAYNSAQTLLSVESDGKIYVGIAGTNYSGSVVNYFVRVNTNGTIDTTFNGSVASPTNDVGFDQRPQAAFISGSNIYFFGGFITYKPLNRIVRINTNGTLDTTFQLGTGLNSTVYGIATQSDGKIVVVGSFNNYSGSNTQTGIVRINPDGKRDTTLNVGSAGFNTSVTALAIQPDNKIVAAGGFTTYSGSTSNRIIRLNISGSRDTTFNVGTGINSFTSNTNGAKILITPSNQVYVTSTNQMTTYSGSVAGNIIRINSDGTLDTTFATTSSVSLGAIGDNGKGFGGNVGSGVPGGQSLVLSGSAVIAVGTFIIYKNPYLPYGLMIDSTGAVSSSFNPGAPGVGFSSTVRSWATQSDGKILAFGDFTSFSGSTVNRIVRLNQNGTRDTTFNTGTGFGSTVFDARLQSDGKIVAVGQFTTYSGSTRSGIVRINTNGTLDTSFNIGTGFTGLGSINCKIQSDDKIVVVGSFTAYSGSTRNRIVRINTDGTLDTTFNVGAGFNQAMETVILQSDGKVIAGGGFTTYSGSSQNRIIRINSDGTRDTTFNVGNGLQFNVYALALQSDNKVVCTHQSTTYSGSNANFIVRINTDGTQDTTFGFHPPSAFFSSTSNTPNGLAIASDDKIYVGNNFTFYSGSFTPNRIVRLNTNGSVDDTFNQAFPNFVNQTGKGADGSVNAILLL